MSVRCPYCGYGMNTDADAVLVLCPKCGEYISRVCYQKRLQMKDCTICSNYELQRYAKCWKQRKRYVRIP